MFVHYDNRFSAQFIKIFQCEIAPTLHQKLIFYA